MRVLHYSHDYYGTDNLQQTLSAAKRIAFEFPEATQLLVTGSPQPSDAKLPKSVDYIKLPSMNESSQIENHAPSLSLPYAVIKTLRETLILDALRYFKPDLVLIEGSRNALGEVFYGLNDLHEKQVQTRVVLGNGGRENTTKIVLSALADVVTAQNTSSPSKAVLKEKRQAPIEASAFTPSRKLSPVT